MSYPITSEERLIKLYGYTFDDLLSIWLQCDQDNIKYKQRVEELDKHHALACYTEMMDENTFVH